MTSPMNSLVRHTLVALALAAGGCDGSLTAPAASRLAPPASAAAELSPPPSGSAEFSVGGEAPLAGREQWLGYYPSLTMVALTVHQAFSVSSVPPFPPSHAELGLAGRISDFGCSHQGEAYLVASTDGGGFVFPFAGCQLADGPVVTSFSDTVGVIGNVRYGYSFDSGCPYPAEDCAVYDGSSGVSITPLSASLTIGGDSVAGGTLRAWPTRQYTLVATASPNRMGRFATPIQPVGSGWTFTPDSAEAEADVCENGSGRSCDKTFTSSGYLTLTAIVNGVQMTSAPLRVQMPAVQLAVSRDSVAVGDTVLATTTVLGADPSILSYYSVGGAVTTPAPGNAGGLPPCLGTKPVPLHCFIVMGSAGRIEVQVGAQLDNHHGIYALKYVTVSGGGRVVIEPAEGGDPVRMPPSEIVGIRANPRVSRTKLRVRVVNAAGHDVPNAVVKLSLNAEELSGGHEHADPANPKPAGSFGTDGSSTLTVSTGSAAATLVTYQAPDPAGLVTVHGTSEGSEPGDRFVTVAVDGLVLVREIPATLQYVGDPGSHHSRFWVTPATGEMLRRLAEALAREYQLVLLPAGATRYLGLNDASLVLGGQFDIGGDWSPPHADHRRGQGADLRTTDKTEDQTDFMTSFWELRLHGGVYDERSRSTNPQSTGPHYHFKECTTCNR